MAFVTGRIRVGQHGLPHCRVELWTSAGLVSAVPQGQQTVSGASERMVGPPSRTDAQGRFRLDAGTTTSGLFIVYRLEDRHGDPAPSTHALLKLRYHHDHEDAWSFPYPTRTDPPIRIGHSVDIQVPDTTISLRADEVDPAALLSNGPLRSVVLDARRRYLASTLHAATIYRNIIHAAARLFDARREAIRLAPTVFTSFTTIPTLAQMAAPPMAGFYPAMSLVTGCARPGSSTAEFNIQPIREARVNLEFTPLHEHYHHLFASLIRPYSAPGGPHTITGAVVIQSASLADPPDPAAARAAFVHQVALDFNEGVAEAYTDASIRPNSEATSTDPLYPSNPPGQPAFGDVASQRYVWILSSQLGRQAGGDPVRGFALFEILAWAYRQHPGIPTHLVGLQAGPHPGPAPIPYTLPGLHNFAVAHLAPAVRSALESSMRSSGLENTLRTWNTYFASPTAPPAPYDPAAVW